VWVRYDPENGRRANVLVRIGKSDKTMATIQGHGAYFKVMSVTTFSKAAWSVCKESALYVAAMGFHLFMLFLFFLFPPNNCAFLVLNRIHIWVPVIYEDTWGYLNH